MQQKMHDWLNNLPYLNPLQQRQAKLLQIMLLLILGGCLIGLPLGISATDQTAMFDLPRLSYPLLFLCTLGALFALRRGYFGMAIGLATLGFMIALGIALITVGLNHSSPILLAFSAPITLAGLVVGRRGLLMASGLSILLVVA